MPKPWPFWIDVHATFLVGHPENKKHSDTRAADKKFHTQMTTSLARRLYIAVMYLFLPLALLRLLGRSRKQPEYRRHWRERLAIDYQGSAQTGVIWLHAVSVGETRAAQPLVAALRSKYPDHRILISHMTPTGRETSSALFRDNVQTVYLPYDLPAAMARFLEHFQPVVGVIMETEIWPNLVFACSRRNIPLILANARLSAKSARGYARWRALVQPAFQGLSVVAAQGVEDARRLEQLGAAKVIVTGNMKFDLAPPPALLELGQALRAMLKGRQMVLCASTRDGEEALILEAWRNHNSSAMVLAIVPRHPQRFNDVAQLAESLGLSVCRRSSGAAPEHAAIWLGDSMGELFAWYAAADVAFIGGSLLDYGCQNLIEACAVGTPVLIGPSTYNFADAARDALSQGAALPVIDAEELVRRALDLLADPARRQVMSRAGLAFARQHRGATARTMAILSSFIPESR